jgi:acyl carrier protein
MSFRDDLTSYIRQNLLRDDSAVLGPDDSLIDAGALDSVGLMNVLSFVESHAGVKVPDSEVIPQNFESVTAIEALVQRLRSLA